MIQKEKEGSGLRNCIYVNSVSKSAWCAYIQSSFNLELKLICSNEKRWTGEMNKEFNLVYSATHMKFRFF